MKTCGALLVVLYCCLAETQLRGETISENDITHQGHYGEAESRENEVMGGAQKSEATDTASTQQTCQPDIHTVLREMSVLVAKLEVELRYTKIQMDAVEASLRASENKAETMETRLRATEQTEEQRVGLRQTEARLTESERKTKDMEGRLKSGEILVEILKSEAEAQAVNLNFTVSQVEELMRERKERRVSFSASVVTSGATNIGPFSAATTLIYRNVISNIGNCYNPNTGVFTAPVRGVYHFVVSLLGTGHASSRAAVALHKNGKHVVIAYTFQSALYTSASNGASLLLEVGDVVYVNLRANAWVYDDTERYTTFSGHLLFPM